MPAQLLHVVGYLTGATLYAMLLVMALQGARRDRLTIGAAVLGVTWNVGELVAQVLRALRPGGAEPWVAALSFGALGLLAAVVIHSVARRTHDDATGRGASRLLTTIAYSGAAWAAIGQLVAAATARRVPDRTSLLLLTCVLVVLAPLLVVATRRRPKAGQTIWLTALAVFAISALHVTSFHGPRESWAIELLGHHSSLPLAFAILYQDYRFALADLFLKQAVTVVLVVATVFGSWSIVGPWLTREPASPRAIGAVLTLWVVSTFLFPVIRRAATAFVDRVVLQRGNHGAVLERITSGLQSANSEADALNVAVRELASALGASAVTWEQYAHPPQAIEGIQVPAATAEAPHYALSVGRLAGGRRLLSDDLTMLDRAATAIGRRIDSLRLTRERYDRMLREREIEGLATQAELRALRAQINPHFLFNALTTIGYLIHEAPARAMGTLLELTTLLRGVLRTDGEFTTLRKEIDLVRCYLEIERARFEERLSVSIEIDEDVTEMTIPTLVIQPLVENAIKHGIADSRCGGHVAVQAAIDGDALIVSVRNSGLPLHARLGDVAGGVGLDNVERRLAAYFGSRGSLTLRSIDSGETVAQIRMPVWHAGDRSQTRIERRFCA